LDVTEGNLENAASLEANTMSTVGAVVVVLIIIVVGVFAARAKKKREQQPGANEPR
jgi:heme/copper-type cytochrome/quinol oxidase subunit 2